MIPRMASLHRRQISGGSERQADRLVGRRGGLISVEKEAKGSAAGGGRNYERTLTKVLVKVTMERSSGAVQVVISSEDTVADLVRAALRIYVAEKRRPLLPETDPNRFELHYSRFSFESLKAEEKLIKLGSRDFFLCLKAATTSSSVSSSCSEEAKKEASNSSFPWAKLMDFLL